MEVKTTDESVLSEDERRLTELLKEAEALKAKISRSSVTDETTLSSNSKPRQQVPSETIAFSSHNPQEHQQEEEPNIDEMLQKAQFLSAQMQSFSAKEGNAVEILPDDFKDPVEMNASKLQQDALESNREDPPSSDNPEKVDLLMKQTEQLLLKLGHSPDDTPNHAPEAKPDRDPPGNYSLNQLHASDPPTTPAHKSAALTPSVVEYRNPALSDDISSVGSFPTPNHSDPNLGGHKLLETPEFKTEGRSSPFQPDANLGTLALEESSLEEMKEEEVKEEEEEMAVEDVAVKDVAVEDPYAVPVSDFSALSTGGSTPITGKTTPVLHNRVKPASDESPSQPPLLPTVDTMGAPPAANDTRKPKTADANIKWEKKTSAIAGDDDYVPLVDYSSLKKKSKPAVAAGERPLARSNKKRRRRRIVAFLILVVAAVVVWFVQLPGQGALQETNELVEEEEEIVTVYDILDLGVERFSTNQCSTLDFCSLEDYWEEEDPIVVEEDEACKNPLVRLLNGRCRKTNDA